MGLRVLVCGGRDDQDVGSVWGRLDALHVGRGGIALIVYDDGARASKLAGNWAFFNKVERLGFSARNRSPAAGPIRNQRMLDEGNPDLVFAFPGGAGTADMVRRAKEAGVKVLDLRAVTPTPARTGDDR